MTTKTLHTPGPWRVVGPQAVKSPTGEVATVYPARHSESIEEEDAGREANARLIAAAPDLLAALRDIIAHERCDCGNTTCWFCRGIAAIKKAEEG